MFDLEEHQADLDWLLALSPHGHKKVPFTVEGKIPKGSQHDTLVSLAGSNRARGCGFAEILALLCETNKRLEEPAPESHLRRIAESVCRYAPTDKRGIGHVERELRDGAAISVTDAKIDDDTLPDFPEIAWRGAFADYRGPWQELPRRTTLRISAHAGQPRPSRSDGGSSCTRANGSSPISICQCLVQLVTRKRRRNDESSTVDCWLHRFA
jgi:hypothetical protein